MSASLYAEHLATLSARLRADAAEAENLAAGLSVEAHADLFPRTEARLRALCRPGEFPSYTVARRMNNGQWRTEYRVCVVGPNLGADSVAPGSGETMDAAFEAMISALARVRANALAAERAAAQSFDSFTR